jgi:SNF2 family DNA or RNA helicase
VALSHHKVNILFLFLVYPPTVDEMQELRSDKSSIAKNIEDLDCDRRWMVSGSPLFEGLSDLRAELAFLRLVPFGANVEGMMIMMSIC